MAGAITAATAPKVLAQVKETAATLLGGQKAYQKKEPNKRLRDLLVVSTSRITVHLAIFVSVNVLRMC